MQIRTDLALEQREMYGALPQGVQSKEMTKNGAKVTKICIENEKGERALGKPKGNYITVEVPAFSDNVQNEPLIDTVCEEMISLIPKEGTALVVGLGNSNITPDALGPKVCESILATRHIGKELARAAGIENARSVAVLTPGVLGQTGMEAFDIIKGVSQRIEPSVVIAIDALASRQLSRLGCTVQMSDSGIEPGAGVGNARYEISKKTLGVPVIAVGVPTVVDAATLVSDLTGSDKSFAQPEGRQMIVTPREIDLLIDRAAHLLSDVINFSLQPALDREIIRDILS